MFLYRQRPDPCLNEIISAGLNMAVAYIDVWIRGDMETEEGKWVQTYLRGGLASLDHPEVINKEHVWLQTYFGNDLEKMFAPKNLIIELKKLINANEEEKIFCLQEYHHLIVYSSIERYIEVHNDEVEKNNSPKLIQKTKVEIIDFDLLVDNYYQSVDFLMNEIAFDPEALNDIIGVQKTASGPVSGYKPHPNELILEEATQEEIQDMNSDTVNYYKENKEYPY
ncbi:MAG: hypothetical protein COA79_09270 [Planctomycetota bacterium]|nr:MAG: hypothetical protein COA79_09270 [Planctomycetota bacterium]